MAEINFQQIEKKWQDKWEKGKLFEANPDKRNKFFVNFPYPYINSYLHLGHGFSSVRVDIIARFKRMQGFNVLFPQGWHCTGMPVWAASQRIKENEPKQIQIMKSQGFSEKEIKKFQDPKHWIDVFVPAAQEDFTRIGNSVDWRRSFITTELNPRYDKFIRWQFRKLKEKGLVVKGKHPVVWCPKDNTPVGDHDRVEGEGETPQEFYLLKFKFDDSYLVAATLRPETVFGETNFWVNPSVKYIKAEVNGEKWIVSEECIEKLKNQDKRIKILGKINGKDIIGKYCKAPLINRDIIILPAEFSDPKIGSGLVTSVPSDAPYDYIALKDLQDDEKEMKKYGLKTDEIRKIKPIPIIESKEWGDLPAIKIVEKMQIKNQKDSKLEEATKVIYKAGFYSGKMNKNCGKYSGMSVVDAKEKMKEEMKAKGLLEEFYELSGKVVCRCLTPSIVKIVSDQWFLKYGDKEWKKQVHKELKNMKLYPEIVRQQFEYVIDWLNDWACTHHKGMGTKLPWDEKWVIESLSDSTIYMVYYTIAHLIKDYPESKINDEFFDFIFLGKGKGDKKMKEMKKEFEYWYPFDIRSSGKDLVQNHLSFCLFNHAAIFPEKYWPRGFSINGWLLVNGEKMSKSKGNFFTTRDILEKYPADVTRATLILGGEGLDDPNFDFSNAENIKQKLRSWYDFAVNNFKKTRERELTRADKIFLSYTNRLLKEGTIVMEEMLFRSAFDKLFYQMQRALKSYISKGKINQSVLNEFIEMQTKAISPFTPFIAEEMWYKIGKKSFVSIEDWPKFNEKLINLDLENQERQIEQTIEDIKNVIKMIKEKQKKETKKVFIYTIPKEFDLYNDSKNFISSSVNAEINVFSNNDKKRYDPIEKSNKAKLGRPSIYLE
ncbi:MAG: leucine--tRNA ligase [Candidatus Nanoarchaeia archaeon]|nr:leucine--tRNA ligase [Candidatus Nanoarchaeia archaeon]MDD5741105.1 leucine--tRNA ligase [Candidatus Nanoarchaeia archaeon]